jgi:hypothetical protein
MRSRIEKRPTEPPASVASAIRLLRGRRVLLDTDLAALYGVEPKALNQAVRRNRKRFPVDFMFQLTAGEHEVLRSQFVTLKPGSGKHRKYQPYAFTEQGVAMLSTVLRSRRAIEVSIEMMRAFVLLRYMLSSNTDLARRLAALERRYDGQLKVVFDAIRELMQPAMAPAKRIGFRAGEPGPVARPTARGTSAG